MQDITKLQKDWTQYPKKIDWDTYEIRCSMLPDIISKKDELTKTAKNKLRKIYRLETLGVEDIISSKYLDKGIAKEEKSIELWMKINQRFSEKNTKRYHNGWINGEPDIIIPGQEVIDTKTCWDIHSFDKKTRELALKDYEYQLIGYGWLLGIENLKIVYTLLSNTEETIERETEKAKWIFGVYNSETTEYQLLYEQIRRNHNYEDIPIEKRVKEFAFTYSYDKIELIKENVLMAREFLKELSKNN